MDYLFLSISIANTLGHHTGLHRIKTEYIWHVYFYILMIYVWKTEMFPYNSSIFFIFDLYNHMIKNKLGLFIILHHSFVLLQNVVSIFKNPFDMRAIHITSLFEISSIPIALFHMGYISKPIYNILYSYSFIFVRLLYFNHEMYKLYMTDSESINNTTIFFLIIFNFMNCGIAWKMKLVPKLFGWRPAIQSFFRPIAAGLIASLNAGLKCLSVLYPSIIISDCI